MLSDSKNPSGFFFDVHAHLTHEFFSDDLPSVIKRASDVIIHCAGSGLEDNSKVLDLSKKYVNVRACLGLYPWDAVRLGEDGVDFVIDSIRRNASSIVCIGEVGLDHFEGESRNDWLFQEWVFEKFLELGRELGKPLLVHSRKAERDVLNLISHHEVKCVIHCFTGSHKLIPEFLKLGCYFSIPSSVVRDGGFQGLVNKVPIDRLLTETDAPFLSPVSGGHSEPFNVKGSVSKIAELKGLNVNDCLKQLSDNYRVLFG